MEMDIEYVYSLMNEAYEAGDKEAYQELLRHYVSLCKLADQVAHD